MSVSMLTGTGIGATLLTASAAVSLALRERSRGGRKPTPGSREPYRSRHAVQQAGTIANTSEEKVPQSVSLVIPAHNEETSIAETIRSCRAQTYPIDQIIVVADNCSDKTAEIARRMGVVVIEGQGGSKALAQNLALPRITSDALVALDGDATLSPRAVELMMGTLRSGCAGTCTSARPKDTRTIYSQYRTLYHAISNGWARPMQDVLQRQLVLSGMANCHRMDVLREAGGFPDHTITEDFNLTWMLHRSAQQVRFTPGAFVYTQEPTSWAELVSQMHRWTAGFAQTMVKHRAPMLDSASFIVVGSQVVDAFIGGVAIFGLPFHLARRGPVRGLCTWWSPLWVAIGAASVGVAVRQVGWRTTLRCLPGWLAVQCLTGPMTAWWLFREWVLGRHLTTWTGRHGRRPALTPMSDHRKAALAACACAIAVLAARHHPHRPASAPPIRRRHR
ncbi:glycosyltransferase family 2 protein [Streptomyces rimosus]|uniref:glycosyltransferase n=1 Tax=Streptomyces rimosus TaxID=1927 RepID=UPI00099C7C77|nr:glycosyltransferase family 2 protein [Streptomyces rimosus]